MLLAVLWPSILLSSMGKVSSTLLLCFKLYIVREISGGPRGKRGHASLGHHSIQEGLHGKPD